MIKVRNVELAGFRGVGKTMPLPLPTSQSMLLFGENGSGKSSITDAVEWFFYDRVAHLSTQEIGRNGIPALRNIHLKDDESASVRIEFSDPALSDTKVLAVKRSQLTASNLNSTPEAVAYKEASLKENLILRYRDLLQFVMRTKNEKLAEISRITGFGEVTEIKLVLKKAVNDLKRIEKVKDYDRQMAVKQGDLIEQLGRNVTTEVQYWEAVRDLVAPLGLPVEIRDHAGIDKALELIKKPEDAGAIALELSYNTVISTLESAANASGEFSSAYVRYHDRFLSISKDAENLRKLGIEHLLTDGLAVLEKGEWTADCCPLCQQGKNREDLLKELRTRIAELSTLRKERELLEDDRITTHGIVDAALRRIESAQRERCISLDENSHVRDIIVKFRDALAVAVADVAVSPFVSRKEPVKPAQLALTENADMGTAVQALKDAKAKISAARKGDLRFTVNEKLALAKKAYDDLVLMKRELAILRAQLASMEILSLEFVKREKKALLAFLESISKDINDLYCFMNGSEKVEGIELVPVGSEEEFDGVTLRMKLRGTVVSPPDKYLSESHVNCLGICLFLASVKAFNHVNGFFVLDDVISSFDKDHRIRFAHLLTEQFADYQVLLFTHEKDWFQYVANLVKGHQWQIRRVVWNEDSGTSIEIPLLGLKTTIDDKIARSDTVGLGNLIRKYLEGLLKEVCQKLEVTVRFLYNDRNEDRMSGELLSALKGTLSKRKCEIKDNPVMERLTASTFLGSKASHDTSFVEEMPDLKMFYRDVLDLEQLVLCPKCGKMISTKTHDPVGKRISCACTYGLKYTWHA